MLKVSLLLAFCANINLAYAMESNEPTSEPAPAKSEKKQLKLSELSLEQIKCAQKEILDELAHLDETNEDDRKHGGELCDALFALCLVKAFHGDKILETLDDSNKS